jgi:L-ascorbate metabolism protein UlaG (beta-lactamase superfamily)
MSYEYNTEFPFIIDNWKGNPINEKGRFFHPDYHFEMGFKEVLKWQFQEKPRKAEKKADTFQLKTHELSVKVFDKPNSIIWLGHASFFMNLNGIKVLFDPVLFNLSIFLKRKSTVPNAFFELKELDYIFISHDHRDHLDEASLRHLSQRFPKVKYITGLRNDVLLKSITGSKNTTALAWYQQMKISEDITITYLPSRHWCRRYLADTNKRLWGSFMIQTKDKTIYFGADSGYSHHFKEIGSLFGNIDVALLGIGAYQPEWFMSSSHTSPKEAFQAALDLGVKTFIPMHHGTFDLSDEPLGDPIKVLNSISKQSTHDLKVNGMEVGEVFMF